MNERMEADLSCSPAGLFSSVIAYGSNPAGIKILYNLLYMII